MPGDKIRAEVYAKYADNNSTDQDFQALLNSIATAISTGNTGGGLVKDGGSFSSSTSSFPFGNYASDVTSGSTGTGPRAFLTWLIFDQDYNLLDGGYDRIDVNAKEGGQDISHDRMFSPEITITKPGFVYIYLSNEESTTQVEVYFDDFTVEQIKSAVVQADDYYPFGLTFNSYQRENSIENKIRFQGQEHVDDLGLNWDSFKWRNHQPDIGRFFNVDQLAEKYYYNSPYAFSENRVIDGVELEGLEWASIKDENSKTIVNTITIKVRNSSGSISNTDAMALAMDIQSQAAKSLSGKDAEGYTNSTFVTLDFESKVEEGDFYIDFVDKITNDNGTTDKYAAGKVDEIGDTQSNRIQINTWYLDVNKDRSDLIRAGVHEIAHTGGLTHPAENPQKPGKDDSGNDLKQGNAMIQNSEGTDITPAQRSTIKKEVEDDTQ